MKVDLIHLREALESSWDEKTSNQAISEKDNPALGQCYPTSRVIQFFFTETEIVEGEVWTGNNTEKHFWNILEVDGAQHHIDITWQQFPHGSVIKNWKLRDRQTLGDGQKTTYRVELLHKRVKKYLSNKKRVGST
jgi:DNA-directed RNA polymerase subunit E'/Rpb7